MRSICVIRIIHNYIQWSTSHPSTLITCECRSPGDCSVLIVQGECCYAQQEKSEHKRGPSRRRHSGRPSFWRHRLQWRRNVWRRHPTRCSFCRYNNKFRPICDGPYIGWVIDKRSIKIFTLGINGTFPFIYSSVSRTYILLKVNKYIMKFVSW